VADELTRTRRGPAENRGELSLFEERMARDQAQHLVGLAAECLSSLSLRSSTAGPGDDACVDGCWRRDCLITESQDSMQTRW
jgi:hypothetical protein